MSLHDYFFLISWDLIWQFLALFLEQLQFYSERIYLCLYLLVYPLIFPLTVSESQYGLWSIRSNFLFRVRHRSQFNLVVIISVRYLYHLFKIVFFSNVFLVSYKNVYGCISVGLISGACTFLHWPTCLLLCQYSVYNVIGIVIGIESMCRLYLSYIYFHNIISCIL